MATQAPLPSSGGGIAPPAPPTQEAQAARRPVKAGRWWNSRLERNQMKLGLLFILPWIIGFLAFTVYPIYRTVYLSMTRFGGIKDPVWIGWANYERLFKDELFHKTLFNTFYYTLLAVPIGVVVAFMIALAMDQPMPEIPLYRTILYLPSILPVFAIAFIFMSLLSPDQGVVNEVLRKFGLNPPAWFADTRTAKIAIVTMAQFSAGQVALVFLAGLKGIPRSLYEAAELDGAGVLNRFFKITVPLMTPVILYDLILGISGGLQVFTQSYIITQGGPANSTNFLVYNLYNNAFKYGNKMGYASAMGVVLFIITFLIAGLVFFTSSKWVNYDTN